MTTTLMDKINDGLADARKKLDALRLNAALFKLEARDKKDEILEDLEKRYGVVRERAARAKEATGENVERLQGALRDAWSAFQSRLEETTTDEPGTSA